MLGAMLEKWRIRPGVCKKPQFWGQTRNICVAIARRSTQADLAAWRRRGKEGVEGEDLVGVHMSAGAGIFQRD